LGEQPGGSRMGYGRSANLHEVAPLQKTAPSA
jgi:hypothetical protein